MLTARSKCCVVIYLMSCDGGRGGGRKRAVMHGLEVLSEVVMYCSYHVSRGSAFLRRF